MRPLTDERLDATPSRMEIDVPIMGKGDTLPTAVIGAIVTIVLSFTGFSALLGGGVAGYLQGEPPKRGARVGAISGAIACIPIFLMLGLGLVAFFVQPSALGVTRGVELAVILLVMFPLLIAWIIGLSAVGGYLGGYIRSDHRPPSSEPVTPERG